MQLIPLFIASKTNLKKKNGIEETFLKKNWFLSFYFYEFLYLLGDCELGGIYKSQELTLEKTSEAFIMGSPVFSQIVMHFSNMPNRWLKQSKLSEMWQNYLLFSSSIKLLILDL